MYTVSSIADWFKQRQASSNKCQRLVYYTYAWGLVFFNNDADHLDTKVFNAKFKAGVTGPVTQVVNQPITPIDNHKVLDLLNQVFNQYGSLTEPELSHLVRKETPWQKARGNAKPLDSVNTFLSDKDMFNYYKKAL